MIHFNEKILDYLNGWRRHTSAYIEEALKRRGVEANTYIKGMSLMLKNKQREMVFPATPCNKWGDPPDLPIVYLTYSGYEAYIQEKVDEFAGMRWSFKYDGTD
jgi:hypothetical protein